jgi:hypothetical protein
MGLSIHYSGHLKTRACLPALIEEVKDVAKIHDWPVEIYDVEFPRNKFNRINHSNSLYGISFTPPGCETVSLCFLSNGQLVGFWSWRLYMKNLGKDKNLLKGGVSVKTHYAGEIVHKTLIHLLDYLSKKYFRSFKLMDEGQYWETRDEKLLHKNFTILNGLMNALKETLEIVPIKRDESFEKYFIRILKKIHAQHKLKD